MVVFALALIGNIIQEEKPIIIKRIDKIKVFVCTLLFFRVYFNPKKKSATKISAAIILPELNGKPTVLIKNNSEALKNFKVKGNKNLNTKANTKTAKIVATAVVFKLTFLYVLKKYKSTIAGITNKESM